jgi:hypothetical protein
MDATRDTAPIGRGLAVVGALLLAVAFIRAIAGGTGPDPVTLVVAVAGTGLLVAGLLITYLRR